MSEPIFLNLEQVKALHTEAIQHYGGTLGIRDLHTLEAAVFHPQNVYFYGSGDLFEIAAAYAFHIAEAQAFLDGNKRAAMGAAIAFLQLNGYLIRGMENQLYDAMMAIAARTMAKTELAALLRRLAQA